MSNIGLPLQDIRNVSRDRFYYTSIFGPKSHQYLITTSIILGSNSEVIFEQIWIHFRIILGAIAEIRKHPYIELDSGTILDPFWTLNCVHVGNFHNTFQGRRRGKWHGPEGTHVGAQALRLSAKSGEGPAPNLDRAGPGLAEIPHKPTFGGIWCSDMDIF